jgi:hypothetical protein
MGNAIGLVPLDNISVEDFFIFSPSFNHCILDFFCQSTSSYSLMSTSWLFKSISYVLRSSVRPCERIYF